MTSFTKMVTSTSLVSASSVSRRALSRGRVDARQVHQHHAGHRALDGDHHRDELDRAHARVGPVAVARVLEGDERAGSARPARRGSGRDASAGSLPSRGLDVAEARGDLAELGAARPARGAPARSGSSTSKPSRALNAALQPHDLRRVQPLPALDAARLERVEVAGDALLELVLAVVGDDRLELPRLARLDDRRAPGAALGLARQELLALEPRREERALALLLQADDADLDDALGEALLAVEAARAEVFELCRGARASWRALSLSAWK